MRRPPLDEIHAQEEGYDNDADDGGRYQDDPRCVQVELIHAFFLNPLVGNVRLDMN